MGGSEPDRAPEASQTSDEPRGVATNLTPEGIEVYYQAGPKRLYRVRQRPQLASVDAVTGLPLFAPEGEWIEVPSVTTILEVLDKSGALTWWGMRTGIEGVIELWKRGIMPPATYPSSYDLASLEKLIVEQKLSTNHVKSDAGERGTRVHTAFEQWADDQRITPQPAVWPVDEQGYVTGLAEFLRELTLGEPTNIEAEVMVGSVEHGFAGRYDLRLLLQKPVEVTTRIYPQKAPKREVIPAGRYMLDLKTSKGVYDTHFLQMEAYEAASIECGYEPTEHRAVIHVTADGRYELARNITKDGELYATIDDYVDVKRAHAAVARINGRKRG